MITNKMGFDTKVNKLKQVEHYSMQGQKSMLECNEIVLIKKTLQLDWMTFYY